jgi:hypothetical protein
VLQERGELLLLSLTCYSSYAIERCDTLSRYCARRVLCCAAFPSVPVLCSTGSAASCPALFVGFSAVGSEEAPIERLASVRRANWTCSFPASSFHDWAFAI